MNLQKVKYKDIEQIQNIPVNKQFKQDFFGNAPAPFIGRFGYPQVNIGVLSPQFLGEMQQYDSPQLWSKNNFNINEIAFLRYSLVNSRTRWSVKDIHRESRLLSLVEEVALTKQAAELEIKLAKIPQLQFKPESEITPWGPASEIRTARITSNTKVDSRVEKVVNDTDLKAASGIINLYKKGFEENTLTKLISVGNLGLKKNRKLVPTRWSITAVDDTIGKELIEQVKTTPIGDYQLYFGGDWGNYYLIMYFPEVWSYELFEMYLDQKPNSWSQKGYFYSTDYENYAGRKSYAEECAGGYYACRLGILEKMLNNKRQNSCLALRFISNEYNVPLGVWVCREATRKSLNGKALNFATQELLFKYAEELIKRKFGFDINLLLKESKLLKEKKQQTKLMEFA